MTTYSECVGGQCVWRHEPGDGGMRVRMEVCLLHQVEDLQDEIACLRAENERLRRAFDAAFIFKNGEAYFRTSGGIPMQMPTAVMNLVLAALEGKL